jgi:peptide/nickel transport system permease protein
MHFKIKNWHLILTLSVIIIIIRFNLLVNTFLLLFYLIKFLILNPSFALKQLNFSTVDSIISFLLILVIPILSIIKKKNLSFFTRKINLTSIIIILLMFFFFMAPLFANSNPNFQKSLSVTKLLPPFSSVRVIHLKPQDNSINKLNEYINLKNEVVKRSFDENIIMADSVADGDNFIYYQNGSAFKLTKSKIMMEKGKPLITANYFLLGTDELGRDIYSRLIYGARISLFVGLGSVVISLLLGMFLGFLAGYPGGIIDSALNRITDMFLAFPVIFLIILILALFGNSLISVIIVLGFSGWMSLFKIVRGEVISLKNKDYFISAKLIGLSKTKLLFKEVMPVILAPIIVNLIFQYANVILAEAALSYLGLGTGSLYPSWGAMIEAGQNYLSQAWWMIFFPGLILFLTLYTANNLGKELNIHFNPRVNL